MSTIMFTKIWLILNEQSFNRPTAKLKPRYSFSLLIARQTTKFIRTINRPAYTSLAISLRRKRPTENFRNLHFSHRSIAPPHPLPPPHPRSASGSDHSGSHARGRWPPNSLPRETATDGILRVLTFRKRRVGPCACVRGEILPALTLTRLSRGPLLRVGFAARRVTAALFVFALSTQRRRFRTHGRLLSTQGFSEVATFNATRRPSQSDFARSGRAARWFHSAIKRDWEFCDYVGVCGLFVTCEFRCEEVGVYVQVMPYAFEVITFSFGSRGGGIRREIFLNCGCNCVSLAFLWILKETREIVYLYKWI